MIAYTIITNLLTVACIATSNLVVIQVSSNYLDQPCKSDTYDIGTLVREVGASYARADKNFELICPLKEVMEPIKKNTRKMNDDLLNKYMDIIISQANITWLKDRQRIHRLNGELIFGIDENLCGDEAKINLFNVGDTDQGRYTCLTRWPKNNLTKLFMLPKEISFPLAVHYPPPDKQPSIVRGPPEVLRLLRGENVTLHCETEPTLLTQSSFWFKSCPEEPVNITCLDEFVKQVDLAQLKQNAHYMNKYRIYKSLNMQELQLRNVSDINTGYYGCVAHNDRGLDIRISRVVIFDYLRTLESTSNPLPTTTFVSLAFLVGAFIIGIFIFRYHRSNDNYPNLQQVIKKPCNNTLEGVHFQQSTKSMNHFAPSFTSASHSDDGSSNSMATTMPMYDHPPTRAFLVDNRSADLVDNPVYGFLRPDQHDEIQLLPRRNLTPLSKLGEGQFGEVYKNTAILKDLTIATVAVKSIKKIADTISIDGRSELMNELDIMKCVNNHPNVVKLLYYCADLGEPTLLIMEYAEYGNLQKYLRACRTHSKHVVNTHQDIMDNTCNLLSMKSKNITSGQLVKFAHDIAKGMEYVASQGILHRDLASRNILVFSDLTCKISDFGFARRLDASYVSTGLKPVPIKWWAPEALFEKQYTTKSDVYSFGVVLWEIVTLGATPYANIDASKVNEMVKSGQRPEKPSHCKPDISNMMDRCWLALAHDRPSFHELSRELELMTPSENDYIELDRYKENAYYNIRNINEREMVDYNVSNVL